MASKCYLCNQPRHHFNECPQRRTANLVTDIQEQEDTKEIEEPKETDTEEVYLTKETSKNQLETTIPAPVQDLLQQHAQI